MYLLLLSGRNSCFILVDETLNKYKSLIYDSDDQVAMRFKLLYK